MNFTATDARIAFARNCVRGAERASLCGERRLAAELRGAAERALPGIGGAVALSELGRYRPETAVIAAAMLNALH